MRWLLDVWWKQWTWPLKLGTLAALVVLLLVVGLSVRSCFRKEPKLNQREIIEAQQAVANQEREKMIEILAESEAREQGIDNSIKAAEEATAKAKQNYIGKSNDELAEELNRRAREQ